MRPRGRNTARAALAIAVGLIAGSTVHAADGPSGFVDGEWTGGMVWDASVQFPLAFGSATSTGQFTMQFTGGVPTGSFYYLVPNGTGDTNDASAEVTFESAGVVEGSADETVLVATSGRVFGSVQVVGYADPFPVDFTMGSGDFDSVPLDFVTVSCSVVTGVFTTRIAEIDAVVSGGGGSLSVQRANWVATRVGEGGATPDDQNEAISQLVGDGLKIANGIDDGTFDAGALEALLRRAEEFTSSIARNKTCEIETPGHFTTAIAGVIADILNRMANHEQKFDIYQFTAAITAGVEAGVFGASSGPAGAALATKINDVLGSKFSAAVAAGNEADLLAVYVAAVLMGNDQLAADALDEASKL